MARPPRPDLPGVAFHLTTRIQGRTHLLTPGLRDRCVGLLRRQVLRVDARLLAYVIMPNHLHLVLVQGDDPLSRTMQPLLCAIAAAVRHTHGVEGHVFERRYRHRICRDADHLRNAIAYTHANPVRAGLCDDPADYRWSSHRLYASGPPHRPPHRAWQAPRLDLAAGLESFAPPQADWRSAGRSAYVGFLQGILPPSPVPATQGSFACSNGAPATCPNDDSAASNDASAACSHDVSPALESAREVGGEANRTDRRVGRRPRLEALAAHILASRAPHLTLDDLRSRRGPRSRLPVRDAVVRAAFRAGYAGREVASFLEISSATVSRILA